MKTYDIELNDDIIINFGLKPDYIIELYNDRIEYKHNNVSIPVHMIGTDILKIFVKGIKFNSSITLINHTSTITELDILGEHPRKPCFKELTCQGFKKLYINECDINSVNSKDVIRVNLRYSDIMFLHLDSNIKFLSLRFSNILDNLQTGCTIDCLKMYESYISGIGCQVKTIKNLAIEKDENHEFCIGGMTTHVHEHNNCLGDIDQSEFLNTRINYFTHSREHISDMLINFLLAECV